MLLFPIPYLKLIGQRTDFETIEPWHVLFAWPFWTTLGVDEEEHVRKTGACNF
jgi:hypothetical protein